MKNKTSILNIQGTNSKVIGAEVANTLYELSKIGDAKSKYVSEEDSKILLDIKPQDMTKSFILPFISDTASVDNGKNVIRKAKYNSWDLMKIPAKYFYDDQEEMELTIGRFIINKFILQGSGVIGAIGVQDKILDDKAIGKLGDLLANKYLENYIDRDQFDEYLDRRDTLGYWINGMVCHTISERMLKPLPEIQKKKAELLKKYEKELENHDLDVMTKISEELTKYAREILEGDPGMDLYYSGELDFGNNYRNNFIIKGAVMNKLDDRFDFVDTSFSDGIKAKDLNIHANSILAANYPGAVATKIEGYKSKKLIALLQMMEVDEKGTDCGSKKYIPIDVTKDNKNDLVYTYISEGGQLKLLTNDNIDQYVGTTVMTRSPMTCLNKKICNKCAGEMFYLLDIKHAGLFSCQMSHAALNLALKAKHNTTVQLYTFDPDSMIKDIR